MKDCDLTEAWVALDKKGKNVAEILFFKKKSITIMIIKKT